MPNIEIYNKNSKDLSGGVKFTDGQREAVNGLIEFFNNPYDETKRITGLIGPGGVGKTFVTKYIINKCKLPNSRIKCTAPTHKACRVFSQAINAKVDTIQSTFGFRLNLNLEDFDYRNPAFRPVTSPKLEDIDVLIIDESSMLNASLVNYINKTCGQLNIKILYIGDSSQLAPVKENKSIAFLSCVKVYELTEIVRQGDNNPILEILDILREDIKHKTFNVMNYIAERKNNMFYNNKGEGFTIVGENEFSNIIKTRFHDEEYTKNIDLYKIIAYTNVKVSQWNHFVRNEIIQDSETNIITKNDLIMSYETIVDEFNSPIINNSEEYIIKDMVNYVDSTYGFKGFLIKFQLVNGGMITKPLFILNSKDQFTMIKYIQTIDELIKDAKRANGATRAKKWKDYYNFKEKYLLPVNIKKDNVILYPRDIDYAFAITAHKS